MLTTAFILKNKDTLIENLRKRGFSNIVIINELVDVIHQRRKHQTLLEEARQELNAISKSIGANKKNLNDLKKDVYSLKGKIKKLEQKLTQFKQTEIELLTKIPNIPHKSVPEGRLAQDNRVIYENKILKHDYSTKKLDHIELGSTFGIIDFRLGTKITGSGFPMMQGKGAKLERALINFFLSEATEKGYKEFMPPFIVNAESAFATGQLPDKDDQMYHVKNDNLYLIPTSEVPLTNIYRNIVLQDKDLPIKITAQSACFRREAGSYGATVRGLNRVHQFNKVEIVQIVKPEDSYRTLEDMCKHVDGILSKLKLHYRMLQLCTGDLGFASAMTYDFEVYSPGQNLWLEVSSVSNFETFQSNRLNLRYKEKGRHTVPHTLNGSALALPRIIVALLEQYQDQGKIYIPEILWPFTGFKVIDKI